MKKLKLRERILAYGGPGSGKTYSWMKLAALFKDSHFHVIDTEIGAERSLAEFPKITNVTIYEAIDWPDYENAQKEIIPKVKLDDWVVIDSADKPYSAVQRYFINEVFKKDMGVYFLDARKQIAAKKKDVKSLFTGKDAALKGWLDWPVINAMYNDFIYDFIYRTKAHLYIVTPADKVSEEDSKETRNLYGASGLKPVGQKMLGHQPDTVLLMSHSPAGYAATTVKDRGGREYMDDNKITNFAIQYGKVAGWL